MGKKLVMNKTYLMKVAIDFGSTNTVMARCVYQKDVNGNPVISQNLNSDDNIIKIPSVMIFADENPGNGAVKRDLFGEEASNVAEHANKAPVVCDNFKQLLYVNEPGSVGYKKGVELCTKFFEYLRSVYRTRIINQLNPQILSDMDIILYLSTPVRATLSHHSEMCRIAENAGFTAANGITEIVVDKNTDEATCVVRYALDKRKNEMKKIFAKAVTDKGALLLFADAGGSTLDSCIKRLYIREGDQILLEPISEWPDPDVEYPLGGCLIDEAIRDYMIEKGYANKEYTMNKWENGDGKYRFRKFKEDNNEEIEKGEIIEYGNVADACCSPWKGINPEQFYDQSSKKINAKIYEEEICKEFICKFKESLKELFRKQRPTEYGEVKPSDIDGIFLTGAGSNLYFIPRVLLEDFDEKTPGFVNVQKDNNLFFKDWEDPSVCCALGALTDVEKIDMPTYAKGRYYVSLQVYAHDNIVESELKKGNIQLSPMHSVFEIGGNKHSCVIIASEKIPVSKKYQILPAVSEFKKIVNFDDNLGDCLTIQVVVRQVKEDGKIKTISEECVHTIGRKFSNKSFNLIKSIFGVIGFIPAIATAVLDSASANLGGKGNLTDAYIDGVEKFFFPTRKTDLNISAKVVLTEHNSISIDTRMESKYFITDENTVSIKI